MLGVHWYVTESEEQGPYGPNYTIRLDERTVVGTVSGAALHVGKEQARANAYGMAASPKLANVITKFLKDIETGEITSENGESFADTIRQVKEALESWRGFGIVSSPQGRLDR